MLDSKFVVAFTEAANDYVNQTPDGIVIWNYVESDLALDGWMEKLGDRFDSFFNDMADQFLRAQKD